MPAPRILITRPAHDAAAWVQTLAGHGLQAEALPLIAIGPCQGGAARQALLRARDAARVPGHWRAIMFVSGNAVQYFFEPNHGSEPDGWSQTAPDLRVWAPGPGTADSLSRQGFAAGRIDAPPPDAAQFESETLWQVVRHQVRAGDRVLIVRGASQDTARPPAGTAGTGREWLAARLREAGAEVEFLAVYERQLPHWSEAQRGLAHQAARDGSLWLFSSSEAVVNLQQILPHENWSQGRALATHERIARQALQAGFGLVRQSRPSLDAVIASIESMA